jgi:hypothetical protein
MPTVHRQDGFAFRIFPADHDPPHVHVYKAGLTAKIAIGDMDMPPYALDPQEMPTREVRRAIRIIEARQEMFLQAWRRFHA